MNIFKTGHLGKNNVCLCLFLFYKVCTHERLEILEMSLFVYVCVFVEGMYTCKTGHFVNKPLCLCCCCCIGYVHM